MKESDLKRAAEDYLQYGMNQGKWYFDRLNSGEVIVVAGNSRRRVKLCREGTADFMVIMYVPALQPLLHKHDDYGYTRIIFLETKSEKGKQRSEQKEFQKLVEEQGAEYHIIRSIEELAAILQ